MPYNDSPTQAEIQWQIEVIQPILQKLSLPIRGDVFRRAVRAIDLQARNHVTIQGQNGDRVHAAVRPSNGIPIPYACQFDITGGFAECECADSYKKHPSGRYVHWCKHIIAAWLQVTDYFKEGEIR